MRRTPLAAVPFVAVLLVALLPPGVAHASPASEYAAKAVTATNEAREANGRKAFKVDDCLLGFAKKQARRMAAAGDIFHQELGPIMDECGLVAAGENVAYGFPTGRQGGQPGLDEVGADTAPTSSTAASSSSPSRPVATRTAPGTPRRSSAAADSYWPVRPSVTSRNRSRWPQWRAVSSIMCVNA